MRNKFKDLRLAVCFKVLGTLCAFSMALVGAVRLEHTYWFCAAALLLFAAADGLLEYNFVFGGTFFALGHGCLIFWMLSEYSITVTHLVVLILLLGILGYIYFRFKSSLDRKLIPPLISYGGILSVMAACAIAGGLSPEAFNTASWLMSVGGALFFISDCILIIRTASKTSGLINWIIMITYYAALLCFGAFCLL